MGGGPAGVAAGVYAGAEGLCALVVEDIAIGGQAGTSSRIENYMGFPTGISGGDLVWRGEVQAMKVGTRFAMPRRVVRLERLEDGSFCANFDNGQHVRAKAVVVATGVQYRRLPLERLADFEGAGIYYAATEIEASAKSLKGMVDNLKGPTTEFATTGLPQMTNAIISLQRATEHVDQMIGQIQNNPRGLVAKPPAKEIEVKP